MTVLLGSWIVMRADAGHRQQHHGKSTFAAEIEEDQAVASAWVCTPALSSSCIHRVHVYRGQQQYSHKVHNELRLRERCVGSTPEVHSLQQLCYPLLDLSRRSIKPCARPCARSHAVQPIYPE